MSIQNQVVCTLATGAFISYGVIFGDVIYDNDCYFVYSICVTAFFYIFTYTYSSPSNDKDWRFEHESC